MENDSSFLSSESQATNISKGSAKYRNSQQVLFFKLETAYNEIYIFINFNFFLT